MKKHHILCLLFITYFLSPCFSSASGTEGFVANPEHCKTSAGYADWERSASFDSNQEFRIACRRHFCENQCIQTANKEGRFECPNSYAKVWCQNVCRGLRFGQKTQNEMSKCDINPNPEDRFSVPDFSLCRRCYDTAQVSLSNLEKMEKDIKDLYDTALKTQKDKLPKFYKTHAPKILGYELNLTEILRNCHNMSCYQQARVCALATYLYEYTTLLQERFGAHFMRDRTNTSSTA